MGRRSGRGWQGGRVVGVCAMSPSRDGMPFFFVKDLPSRTPQAEGTANCCSNRLESRRTHFLPFWADGRLSKDAKMPLVGLGWVLVWVELQHSPGLDFFFIAEGRLGRWKIWQPTTKQLLGRLVVPGGGVPFFQFGPTAPLSIAGPLLSIERSRDQNPRRLKNACF